MRIILLGFLLFATLQVVAATPRERELSEVAAALSTSPRVRVLVSFPEPIQGEKRRAIESAADALIASIGPTAVVRRRFVQVPAVALEIDRAAFEQLQNMPDVLIGLDEAGTGHMREAVPLARLDSIIAANAGSPVKVAVIDSGIAINHPDFSGRIVGQQCFCSSANGVGGCCPNGTASQSGSGAAADDHGHGTNVSGILASGGAVSVRSAAARSSIVAIKVLDSRNSFCCSSDVIAAFDWLATQHPDTKVVNASLGTGALYEGMCDNQASFTRAFSTSINNLVNNGTMVFVSSGNQGNTQRIAAPACIGSAFAVGATWDASSSPVTFLGCTQTPQVNVPTCFTNSSSQVALYAPGAFLTSSGRDGNLSTMGGTSQATPLTASCATALRAEFPAASVAQVSTALRESPTRVTDLKNGLSFPRLDCTDARARLASIPPPRFTLTVAKAGNGANQGRVTSVPSGIDCLLAGSMCSATFDSNTVVVLSAAPGASSSFSGWSGACSGTTCTVTMSADRSVTATFSGCDVTQVAGDCDLDGIPNGIEAMEGRNPLTKDNDVFAVARLFVMQQFRDFLKREGDTGGISFWNSEISAGRETRASMAQVFLASPEYANTVAPMTRLYFGSFVRIPDFDGLAFWTNEFASGRRSLETIAEEFARAPEFVALYGQLANQEFIERIYQNILGRGTNTDVQGAAFWRGELDSARRSRGQVLLAFTESGEYRSVRARDIEVVSLYNAMLQRAASSAEVSADIAALRSGSLNTRSLIQRVIDSTEYRRRFLN
jgi:Subtilase family/Domain of unknown function (DUF4214)/Divergent InlB B-repeat domain